jgi:prepilin-type N-terminal cleavage/methylation domain-containing protein
MIEERNKSGFTLIEVLIYIAIVALVITTLVQFILSISQSRNKNYVVQEVQGNVRSVVDIISRNVRSATDIQLATSTLGTDPGVLVLTMASSSLNPTIFSLSADDGVAQIKQGSQTTTTLTSDEVRVTNFVFIDTTGSSTRKHMKLEMTVESASTDSVDVRYDQSIETTFGIRY